MSSDRFYPIYALAGEAPEGTIAGKVGRLEMIPIDRLFIDSEYQRAVTVGSVRNIKRICSGFDWSKFLPVIVTEDDGRYCIVDGQHRTTAAATIGVEAVPCYILACSPSEAAEAFAAINGNVTPVQPIDLWFAEIAAKNKKSLALKRVLDAASVTITRKKEAYLVGETRSINVLRRAFDFYGPSILTTILQCITETGTGNPGMINGAMLNGIGRAIRTKSDLLASPSTLFTIFDKFDLARLHEQARLEHAQSGNPAQFVITRILNERIRAGGERHAA